MPSLADILDDLALLISRAEQSVAGRTFDDLIGNDEAYDALTYRLAMIGETCKKLPDDIKARDYRITVTGAKTPKQPLRSAYTPPQFPAPRLPGR